MIIYHQTNVGGLAGASIYYGTLTRYMVVYSETTAAAANTEIELSRSTGRFIFSRLFGRVN